MDQGIAAPCDHCVVHPVCGAVDSGLIQSHDEISDFRFAQSPDDGTADLYHCQWYADRVLPTKITIDENRRIAMALPQAFEQRMQRLRSICGRRSFI